jgi:hypothetical protein
VESSNFLGFLPLRDLFSLDLRSLAVLRIGLAFLLFLDWFDRLPDLGAHYSDAGIVPRDSVVGLNSISLHLFHGSVWFQAILAGFAFLFAFFLLVGYRTPFATLVSWFLLLSVQARFPPGIQGGDQLLRMLLFWGIFLPLGACYSIDSSRPGSEPRKMQVLSPASVAYIIQLCLVYWFASAWKWAPEWRTQGSAIYLALKVDFFTTRFAHFMLGYPEVLRYMTFAALWLEALGPAILFFPFAPGFQRLLVISAFILFHVGLAISLELANFPWVCCVAWLALLPPSFWNRLGAQMRDPEVAGLVLYHDGEHPRAARMLSWLRTFLLLGEAKIAPAQEALERLPRIGAEGGWSAVDTRGDEHFGLDALKLLVGLSPVFGPLAGLFRFRPVAWLGERLARSIGGPRRPARQSEEVGTSPAWMPPGGWIGNTIVVFCLVYIILWNVRTFDMGNVEWYSRPDVVIEEKYRWVFPNQAAPFGIALGLDQGWGLFAPRPGRAVGWHLVIGTRKDGTTIDLLRGGKVIDRDHLADYKPELLAATYPNGRWRKMMMNLPITSSYPHLPEGLAWYYFREWNATHEGAEQLDGIEVVYMREETRPAGQTPPPVQPITLFRYPPVQPDLKKQGSK